MVKLYLRESNIIYLHKYCYVVFLRVIVHVWVICDVKELQVLEIQVCLFLGFSGSALLKGFSELERF